MFASLAVLYMWCVSYTLAPAPAHDPSHELMLGLTIAASAYILRMISRDFVSHRDQVGLRLFLIIGKLLILGTTATLIRSLHDYLPDPFPETSCRILFVSLISTFIGIHAWEIRKLYFRPITDDGKIKEWLTQKCPRCEERLVNAKTGVCHGCSALYPFIEVPDPNTHVG